MSCPYLRTSIKGSYITSKMNVARSAISLSREVCHSTSNTCQVTRASNRRSPLTTIKPECWSELLCAFLPNIAWGQHHFLFGIKLPLQKLNYLSSSSTFWFVSATPQPHKEAALDTALTCVLALDLYSCRPSHSKVPACHLHLTQFLRSHFLPRIACQQPSA